MALALSLALPSPARTPWSHHPCVANRAAEKSRSSFTAPLVNTRIRLRPLNTRPCFRVSASSANSDGGPSAETSSVPSASPTTGDLNDVTPTSAGRDTESGKDSQRQSTATSSVGRSRRVADSTDWIASAVTRRFGIGAGLAWVGFLAFGVVSEQIKTRREVFLEESNTRDVEDAEETELPNGVRFTDLRVGGGAIPQKGDLVLVSLTGRVSLPAQAEVADSESESLTFIDTTAPGARDLVFSFGIRPFPRGVTEGLVLAMATMRAGGRRKVLVPGDLGDGGGGVGGSGSVGDSTLSAAFRAAVERRASYMHVKGGVGGEEGGGVGGAVLEYVVELKRVSTPPSSAGALLGLCWGSAGALLELCWGSAGALLELCWGSAGALLGLYWGPAGDLLSCVASKAVNVAWQLHVMSKASNPSNACVGLRRSLHV
ncbi:unnamed protein product [Closterium sp. NIES-64]|nr:unnamed protein product [Closterium sp. NIES-64]